MKAYYRKDLLETGEEPAFLPLLNKSTCYSIDWSKSYASWQPDCLDNGLNSGTEGNMLLAIEVVDGVAIVLVNSIDFDFIKE